MTIRAHLDIFQQSNLLYDLKKFDRKLRRELKSVRKYYAASPSLMYAMLYKTNVEDSAFLGHAAETYAFQKLRSYGDKIYVETGRNPSEEVDFYLPHQNTLIECKYANRFHEKELKYINLRASSLNARQLILTKNQFTLKGKPMLPLCLL